MLQFGAEPFQGCVLGTLFAQFDAGLQDANAARGLFVEHAAFGHAQRTLVGQRGSEVATAFLSVTQMSQQVDRGGVQGVVLRKRQPLTQGGAGRLGVIAHHLHAAANEQEVRLVDIAAGVQAPADAIQQRDRVIGTAAAGPGNGQIGLGRGSPNAVALDVQQRQGSSRGGTASLNAPRSMCTNPRLT